MEKLIATLHNNSMGAKSPSLVSSGSAGSFVKPTEDLEYRKRGNSAMKIGRKPGSTSRDYVAPRSTFVSPFAARRSSRAERPFSKARHASVHN